MSTAYVYDPLYLEHNRWGHVERRERLEMIVQTLEEEGLPDRLVKVEATAVPMEYLLDVHVQQYIDQVKKVADNCQERFRGVPYRCRALCIFWLQLFIV